MSSKKRTSLDAVFGDVELVAKAAEPRSRSKTRRGKTVSPVAAPAAAVAEKGREVEAASKRPAVKQHTAYLPIAIHEQLRKLAFEENRKIHDYLMEGLDRVFADRGLPALKDVK